MTSEKMPRNAKLRCLICIAISLLAGLFFGWDMSIRQFLQSTSILMALGGTYVITKVTFVEFLITYYKNAWMNFEEPSSFFRFVCRLYFIDASDLVKPFEATAPDLSKFRKAISFHDPFRGFLWIVMGSLVQLTLIRFLQ